MAAWLSESALRRVLQSLISATRRMQAPKQIVPHEPWADSFLLGDGESAALGCDSLDLLQIATAVNEMFHLHEAHLETQLVQSVTFGQWVRLVQEAWQEGVQQVTFTTSGSTGRPKPCTHQFSALALEVDTLAALFAGTSRIVAFTPAHHIYGFLFTAMLPDRLGVPVQPLLGAPLPAAAAGGGSTSPGTVLQPGDLIVTFPDGWRWIDANIRSVPAGVQGVTSTAPCPPELVELLGKTKLAGFTEVYGSTETAGIGTRRWPEAAYTLMPHWQRLSDPLSGEEVLRHSSGFTVEAMDQLQFLDERTFLVAGRKDKGIQIGGVNVFPTVIAARLCTFPGVAQATVRAMRPDEGQRLKSFIVAQGDQAEEDLEAKLRRWIETWPVPAERPKSLTFGTTLPSGALGKAADW